MFAIFMLCPDKVVQILPIQVLKLLQRQMFDNYQITANLYGLAVQYIAFIPIVWMHSKIVCFLEKK